MHAIVFERYGGPEVLEYKEVPEPEPRDGQVLVEVEAVGVNYRDVYEREADGYGSSPPAVIGVEAPGGSPTQVSAWAGWRCPEATPSGWSPPASSSCRFPKACRPRWRRPRCCRG